MSVLLAISGGRVIVPHMEPMRTCNRCKQSLPATPVVFLRDASRPLGLAYECRPCHSSRKKGRDRRKERWSAMTPEQRAAAQARNLKYSRTDKGRAVFLRKAYQRIDACDLSTAEVLAFIQRPCVYCGTETANRGLDRIDNSLPHIKGNVQTACTECNIMRGDRFTVDEMKRIGLVVAQIRADRLQGCAAHGS